MASPKIKGGTAVLGEAPAKPYSVVPPLALPYHFPASNLIRWDAQRSYSASWTRMGGRVVSRLRDKDRKVSCLWLYERRLRILFSIGLDGKVLKICQSIASIEKEHWDHLHQGKVSGVLNTQVGNKGMRFEVILPVKMCLYAATRHHLTPYLQNLCLQSQAPLTIQQLIVLHVCRSRVELKVTLNDLVHGAEEVFLGGNLSPRTNGEHACFRCY